METITFITDENLIGKDLSGLKTEFESLCNFIYKQTGTYMNTSNKAFNRDIIKKMDVENVGVFTSKVCMDKPRMKGLQLSVLLKAPSTHICLIWNSIYESEESYHTDVKYILDNIESIGVLPKE